MSVCWQLDTFVPKTIEQTTINRIWTNENQFRTIPLRGCDFIVPVTLRVTGTFVGFKKITASQSDSDGRGFEVQRN